jgi:hypothetical protein
VINLLPPAARTKVSREYRRRLLAVALVMGSAVLTAGAGLLVPAYLTVRADREVAVRAVAQSSELLSEPALVAAAAEIGKAETLYKAVAEKSSSIRPSAVISLLIAARQEGVTVRQITYGASGGSVQATLGGVASTREELLAFKNALLSVPGVSSAEFPTADLAASSTVVYSIRIKYTPPAIPAEPAA